MGTWNYEVMFKLIFHYLYCVKIFFGMLGELSLLGVLISLKMILKHDFFSVFGFRFKYESSFGVEMIIFLKRNWLDFVSVLVSKLLNEKFWNLEKKIRIVISEAVCCAVVTNELKFNIIELITCIFVPNFTFLKF